MSSQEQTISYIKAFIQEIKYQATTGNKIAQDLLNLYDEYIKTTNGKKLTILEKLENKIIEYKTSLIKHCEICNEIGDCGGTCNLCANCWEIKRRLEVFIRNPKGLRFVYDMLDRLKRA